MRSIPLLLTSLAAVLLGTAALVPAPAPAHPNDQAGIDMVTVSNPHPELVSGGEVLLRVTGTRNRPVRVTENGGEIGGFVRQPDGSLLGLVTGLRTGGNRLVAMSNRNLRPPDGGDGITTPVTDLATARIRRRKILGGLIHEYGRAA